MTRYIIIFVTVLIVACTSNSYNPTVYRYEYNDVLAKHPIKTVMIIPVNYEKPSRHYLQRYETLLDESVKSYLDKSGYKVMSNRGFPAMWKNAQLEFGNAYNPGTGEMTSGYKPALQSTLNKLFAQLPQLDAVIFTNLLESPLQYSLSSKRMAQWDGVSRKVKVEGVGDNITDEFNWAQIVDGISIGVYVFNREQQLIQHSVGGIQIAQAVKLSNKTAQFSRRHDLLVNNGEINEGIELAFHPWIQMKDYPGTKP